jgi:hypothetical protein
MFGMYGYGMKAAISLYLWAGSRMRSVSRAEDRAECHRARDDSNPGSAGETET